MVMGGRATLPRLKWRVCDCLVLNVTVWRFEPCSVSTGWRFGEGGVMSERERECCSEVNEFFAVT